MNAPRRRDVLTALVAAALLPAAPALAADAQTERAVAATSRLLQEANAALRAGATDQLRGAIEDAFAFDIWERFLIGTRAAEFTAEQSTEFRNLLPGFLAHLYREQFDKGLTDPPKIGEARPARRDVLVSSVFTRTNGRELPVDWRIRELPNAGPRVIDVMVAGTSFLLLKRDEFTAIIDRDGPTGVLDHMKTNTL